MTYHLYPHGGSGNHGCEAIVRSTAKLLGHEHLRLYSSRPSQDYSVSLDSISEILNERKRINPHSLSYLKAFFRYYILKDRDAYERLSFSPILKSIKNDDVLMSIGGDNYCYGVPIYIYLINREVRKRRIKTVLWGCSIESESIQSEMIEDLKGYTKIFARESITYKALTNIGLKNVCIYPDPAFQLSCKSTAIPDGFVDGNTVGINVSPLIIGRETSKGMTMENYIQLIEFIIHQTDMQVALIPHVVWTDNDDRKPLGVLYEQFKETGRVIMIGDHTAEELKDIISHCRFMVAARTHASIAAYSKQVPTLVVGYSVKARGIAKDIFGNEDHYVIPVQSLSHPNELTVAFKWLMVNEDKIRNHYASFMPHYIMKALEAGKTLKAL